MAKTSKPWEEKWKIESQLPGGGQCYNYIVTPSSTNTVVEKVPYVLKVIKDASNFERRARFYREVHTYINLVHPAIPKINDHNCHGPVSDNEEKLFFVYPYIDGPNLEDFVKGGGLTSVVDSFSLAIKLAEILLFIHDRDIIHRDIKPDNIILRNGKVNDPVLIDFGLSASLSDEVLPESLNKQLGNRFLYLPELKLGEANKRDKRSDITYVVGVLYFLLTKSEPVHLLDEEGKYPHQRVSWNELESSEYKDRVHLIMRVFDIGFNNQLNSRFQTIQHFIEELDKIKKFTMDDSSDFKSYLKESGNKEQLDGEAALTKMLGVFRSVFMYPVTEIPKEYPSINMAYSGPSVNPHFKPMAIIGNYYPTDKFDREIKTRVDVRLYPNGSEYLISTIINENETVFERFQNIEDVKFKEVADKIIEHVLKDFAEVKKSYQAKSQSK